MPFVETISLFCEELFEPEPSWSHLKWENGSVNYFHIKFTNFVLQVWGSLCFFFSIPKKNAFNQLFLILQLLFSALPVKAQMHGPYLLSIYFSYIQNIFLPVFYLSTQHSKCHGQVKLWQMALAKYKLLKFGWQKSRVEFNKLYLCQRLVL